MKNVPSFRHVSTQTKSLIIFPLPTVFFIVLIILETEARPTNLDTPFCNEHHQDDRCICYLEDAIEGLTNTIRRYSHDETQMKVLFKAYHCFGRIELPDVLVIDAAPDGKIWSWEDMNTDTDNSFSNKNGTISKMRNEDDSMEAVPQRPSIYRLFDRRRVRKRIKRTIRLGIPTEETFNNAIANISQNAQHRYIILGDSASLDCGVDDSDGEIVKYSWTHNNDEPITAPMSKVNEKTGTLSIPIVQFTDVGLYKCSAFRKDDGSGRIMKHKAMNHQISVISEPMYFMTYDIFYITKTCNPHELELIKEKIPEWIKYYVFKFSEIHSITIKCNTDEESRNSKQLIEITMTVSAIGFQFTSSQSSLLKKCEILCLETIHSKILNIMQDSVTKLFKRPIEVKGENQRYIHEPELSLMKSELFQECLPGFAIDHKLCFPCNPGKFSQPKMKICEACHIGTYQNKPGSKECIPCPDGTTTLDVGSTEELDCYSNIITNPVNLVYSLLPEKLTGRAAGDYSDYYDDYWHSEDNGLDAVQESEKQRKLKMTIIWIIIASSIVIIILIILTLIRCCCPYSGIGKVVSKLCCCCCPAAHEKTSKKKDKKESLTKPLRKPK